MKTPSRLQEALVLFNVTKLLVLMLLVALVYCSFTTVALISLFPLKEVRPYLVGFSSKTEQVVNIEPLSVDGDGLSKLKEKMARQYVVSRESIDLHTDIKRWEKLVNFHDEDVEMDFSDKVNVDNTSSYYHSFRERKIIRKVRVLSSQCLAPTAPDVYLVEWEAKDIQNGKVIGNKVWVSNLTIELLPKTFALGDELDNAIGFTVTEYTVNKKEI